MITITPELFNNLARSRRSTFPDQFDTTKKADDNSIKEILINALWAPNHGKQEPWHFTVFSGDGLQNLANFQSELYKKEAGNDFKEITYTKLQQNPLKASHVIAIGMKKQIIKTFPKQKI